MKALVFSDLHLAHSDIEYDFQGLDDEIDIAIVAGDITSPVSSSMRWLWRELAMKGISVVFVSGNHEHYGHGHSESMQSGREAKARCPGVWWLENDALEVMGVRFLGCCLWTDFNLYHQRDRSMQFARNVMNDYKVIYHASDLLGDKGFFSPNDTLAIHQESRAWLEGELAKPFNGKTVVITHHAPHPGSIHPRFFGDALTPAFASDLSNLIEKYQPDLWVHGHVHHNVDYMVGKTRILCNPRGYVRDLFSGREVENPAFDPFLMIEI